MTNERNHLLLKKTQNEILSKSRMPHFKKGSKTSISVVMDCPHSLNNANKIDFLSNIITTARAYKILLIISDDSRIKSRQENVLAQISETLSAKLKGNVLAMTTEEALLHIAEKEHVATSDVQTYWFVGSGLHLIPESAAQVAASMRDNYLFMGLGSTSIVSENLVSQARSEPMYGSVSKHQIRECWGSFSIQSPIMPSEVFLTSSAAHTALNRYRCVEDIDVSAIMQMMGLSNIVVADNHTAYPLKRRSRSVRSLVSA